MKINPSLGFDRYRSVVQSARTAEGSAKKGVNTAGAAAGGNTDKVTFSEESAARAELSRLNATLANEVEDTASPEKLASLAHSVNSGTYFVDSDDLADAILGSII